MNNLKYICVQPRLVYYAWQLEVMINNFLKNNIDSDCIEILISYNPNPNDLTNHPDVVDKFKKLTEKFTNVKFFFYKDTRANPGYISSVRPNALKQHFKNFPELSNFSIFYHDCDMIFTSPPDFKRFTVGDTWYLSDTNSYINSRYIISKDIEIYNNMCSIVGIDPKIPKIMNSNSGGAQYLMKKVDHQFWEKVESDSEKLYSYLSYDEPIRLAKDPTHHPIQKWTSDMWAVLWNAWYFEHETKVDPYFNFCWATDSIEKWNQNVIFHNAGVVSEGETFFKGQYLNKLPYFNENNYNPKFCSYNYFQEILETAKNTCLAKVNC